MRPEISTTTDCTKLDNHAAELRGPARVTPQEIDRALRTLASRRATLDLEEARWLRLADAQKAWAALGYVHAVEYLEDVFGYMPHTATERLRVAKDLAALPELEAALESGDLNYSIVRELTRVATPTTVDRWLTAARGRNACDVQRMISGRRKGDDPDTTPDPKLVKHGIWLDLDAESFALYRQARAVLDDELGQKLDDKTFIVEIARRILAGQDPAANANRADHSNGSTSASASASAPARMIHITTCRRCERTWQDGAGVRVELDATAIDLARCDAIIVDDETGKRARTEIPPTTRRKVLERAEHRCQVPGCRSSQHLDIHHIIRQADGGTHDLWSLIVLCSGHHRLHHDGRLSITGRAPDALIFARQGRPLLGERETSLALGRLCPAAERVPAAVAVPHRRPGAQPLSAALPALPDHATDARTALTQMGYKAGVAKRAVERACAHVGANVDLRMLIREALRHCG